MARINDLERGFEKTLAYAYGKHVVQGHLIMHNIDIIGAEKQVTLLMALGDGAYTNQGHGAWGINAQIGTGGGGTQECLTILKLDHSSISQADGSEITSLPDEGTHGYTFVPIGLASTTGPLYDTTPADNARYSEQSGPTLRGLKSNASLNNDISLLGAFTMTLAFTTDIVSGTSTTMLFHVDDNVGAGGNDGWRVTFNSFGGFFSIGMSRYSTGPIVNIGGISSGLIYSAESPQKMVVTIISNGTDVRIIVNGTEVSGRTWSNNVDSNTIYNPTSVGSSAKAAVGTGYYNTTQAFFGKIHYIGIISTNVSDTDRQAIEAPLASLIGASYTSGICSIAGDPCTGGSGESPVIEPDEGAVEAVYYAGRLISPSNWHYHPGTYSTGADDPIQGIDSYFPEGITYSGTAYIAIRLPIGVAEDADPSKVAIIINTSCIADYDEDGNETEISYSANPARIKADMLKRRGQHTRINWDSYIQARDWYDELLPWESGDITNTYTDFTGIPTFTLSGNVQFVSGSLSKPSAVTAYDNTAKTIERVASGNDGYFEFDVGGSFGESVSGADIHFVDSTGKSWFGISYGHGHLSIFANGVSIDDADPPYLYPVSLGDTLRIASDGGEFVLRQNGVIKVPEQGTSLVPLDTDLFVRVLVHHSGASLDSVTMQGQIVDTTELNTTSVPRFEAHPAFTAPVMLTDALDFVDSLCASDTQDAGDEIIFLTPQTPFPKVSVFTFIEDVNVIQNSLRVYRKDIRERPNRLSGQFRNLGRVYLDQDEVFDSRDELFDDVGYIVDPGALNFASMNGSQAQRLIKFNMRRMSDNDLYCDLGGMLDSFALLPGDIVTVISDKLPNGEPTDFIVLSATRESGESVAYERSFVLQEWHIDNYRDSDHGPETGVITPPIPSPFDPPSAPILFLEQSTDVAGDTVTNKIVGTVNFAVYLYDQTAKIYVTVPGGSETDTGIVVTPVAGTTVGTFEYIPPVLGTYQFRAEAISYTGVVGGSSIASINVVDVIIDDTTEELIVEDTGDILLDG